jgi:hypothetical protein
MEAAAEEGGFIGDNMEHSILVKIGLKQGMDLRQSLRIVDISVSWRGSSMKKKARQLALERFKKNAVVASPINSPYINKVVVSLVLIKLKYRGWNNARNDNRIMVRGTGIYGRNG